MNVHSLRALTGGLLLLLCAAAGAEESVRPGINEHYRDARWEQWVDVFESPGREIYDRREAILAAVAPQPGQHIADVGAGTGLFTRLFARAVGPQGRVYAVDIAPDFIANIERFAMDAGLDNVSGIVNTDRDVMLPANSVDLVFLCDTYHHFEYPESMLASIRRALRADGQLVVIDYRKVPGRSSAWVMNHVRTGSAGAIAEIEAAGYRLLEQRDLLEANYYLRFGKAG